MVHWYIPRVRVTLTMLLTGVGLSAVVCWSYFVLWPGWLQHRAVRALREANDMPAYLAAIGRLEELHAVDAAVPYLRAKANSKDGTSRMFANVALRRVGKAAGLALPELINALEDKDVHYNPIDAPHQIGVTVTERDFVHYYAVEALANVGPSAKAAVPALIEEMHRTNRRATRLQVEQALRKIDPGAATWGHSDGRGTNEE